MARGGKVDIEGLKEFKSKIEKNFGSDQVHLFIEQCAKELTARLIAKVVKRTPVGDYSGGAYTCASGKGHKGSKIPGKVGGTLRRGWTGGKTSGASAYVNGLKVHYYGGNYVIELVNPVEYASYVEFGHRTRGGKGWVEGHFMLTISEQEIQRDAPKILEKLLKKKLGECFK
jgi:hypothetical protein